MPLTAGARLGPYEIVAPLGAGGMGEVYKARDARLDRIVAIKVLHEHLAGDPDRRARFDREARAISKLNHPNICTLYDVGHDHDVGYLVVEYLDGETLAERLRRGPLPVDEAVAIAIELAGALDAAHRAGVVHRDFKPANVMLTKTGAKLLDFGIARLLTTEALTVRDTTLTLDGARLGTAHYMAPEQINGREADERTDIFAFGAVVYEMLTGRRAFTGETLSRVCQAILASEPMEIATPQPAVSEMQRIVRRCLAKEPTDRWHTTTDLIMALRRVTIVRPRSGGASLLRWLVAVSVVVVVAVPTLAVLRLLNRTREMRWAREQGLPQIAALTEQEKYVPAFDVALRAERTIPDDPELVKAWTTISRRITIHTEPPGADVMYREYGQGDKPWRPLGRTPIDLVRIPQGLLIWTIRKPGYEDVIDTTGTNQIMGVTNSYTYRLDKLGATPTGMVRVSSAGAPASPRIPGADQLPVLDIPDYWIDKYEVTNREYKRFVEAGGYRDQKFWAVPFVDRGRTLTWADVRGRLTDTTGRPGPATWELGSYPEGQADFPVSGISWYEADAYARFAGKELPTIYHWTRASAQNSSPDVIPLSNFSGRGPAKVGSYPGTNRFGTYDMAGNVKEWVWNQADDGNRYIMGGAWDEPDYLFTIADARSPLDRRPTFGLRCIRRIASAPDPAAARAVMRFPTRDFSKERPVGHDVFKAYLAFYSYDKGNLNATIESRTDAPDWIREKISFNAAYGNERMAAYLFLPKTAKPRYQTIVWFPPSGALTNRSSERLTPNYIDFVVRSGRALIYPVYKGTFERGDGISSDVPNDSSFWRDHVIAWSKDIGRSIDYLETRQDIAIDKLAYGGFSWGAAMAAIMPAVEPRFKVAFAIIGGFNLQPVAPEVSAFNFAPHVTVPVLMLNGKYDYFYPFKLSQEPMFRFLGTPADRKRRVVYDTGHNIPRAEMIKETLDWLDRYLGLVN